MNVNLFDTYGQRENEIINNKYFDNINNMDDSTDQNNIYTSNTEDAFLDIMQGKLDKYKQNRIPKTINKDIKDINQDINEDIKDIKDIKKDIKNIKDRTIDEEEFNDEFNDELKDETMNLMKKNYSYPDPSD